MTTNLVHNAIVHYGAPEEGAQALSGYTDQQLELLTGFLRGSAAYQQRLMQRLDALRDSTEQAPGVTRGDRAQPPPPQEVTD